MCKTQGRELPSSNAHRANSMFYSYRVLKDYNSAKVRLFNELLKSCSIFCLFLLRFVSIHYRKSNLATKAVLKVALGYILLQLFEE